MAASGRHAGLRATRSKLRPRRRWRCLPLRRSRQDCEEGEADAADGGPLKIRDQTPGADGAEPQQKRHERSNFSAAGRFGAPERYSSPRAGMRDHDVDQRRRDQQQFGLEREIAHYMRRIGAEQQEPMLIASRKPKREKGSSNCAIGWIGIARPNPSNLKSSARIDPTSTTKPRICRISTAG
jgi:hypothetical protein